VSSLILVSPVQEERHVRHVAPLLVALVVLVDGSPALAQGGRLQTVINGTAMTDTQRVEFIRTYGTPPLAGDFWYDTRSGLWGVKGREAFGLLRPGHNYGTLAATASAGTTGVFINGRQINVAEALYLRNLLGTVIPGRWWLDGATGYFGLEGNPLPAGNVLLAVRAAQSRGGGGSGGAHYYNDGMGTSIATSSGCATGSTGVGSGKIDFIIGCD
jgi:hypothetical protein